MHPTARRLLAAAGLFVLLSACGGGGDGPASAPTPAPPPPVTITSQPRDMNVEERQPATFSLGVSAAQPYGVEWLRNGAMVDSARGSAATIAYTLPAASLVDDGASFSARITVGANSAGGGNSMPRGMICPDRPAACVSGRGQSARQLVQTAHRADPIDQDAEIQRRRGVFGRTGRDAGGHG